VFNGEFGKAIEGSSHSPIQVICHLPGGAEEYLEKPAG
jgi:hypothetical protein